MRFACVLFIALAVAGCAPVESPRRSAPQPGPTPSETTSEVTRTAQAAFAARDLEYAAQLRALADDVDAGNVKFDAKLKQRLAEAQERAAAASNGPLANVMATEFGPHAIAQPSRVARSLRDLAAALDP